MDGITCDMCGKPLLADEDVRYKAEVRVWAAYDVMEVSRDDLERRDVAEEIRKTLAALEGRDAADLEDEVYALRRFDLCPPCRKRFLDSPHAGAGVAAVPFWAAHSAQLASSEITPDS